MLTLQRSVSYTIHTMDQKIVLLQDKFEKSFQQFNSKRKPRTNALILAGLILLGGFMMYNFVGQQLTQVASKTYGPAVATPKPSLSISPTFNLTPTLSENAPE